ncbi:LytR/AlgR family response regulator transcription factor [Fibrella aquatilis]|uniref:Response regulator transcription factor n=1 Tax=Fibrella aquatilis TaxID=2817059 RepID=A0A939G7F8_9BACT|nr:LytTR family DNA-binding domain-containing protein [Fibrella aquatilis]MBO0931770.1 response regulator transcription factor [Fibrella aquatilis]
MIRAIALDDEPPALRVIDHFCQQVDFVSLQQTFTRTDEAQQYLATNPVDLLFLDINMPKMSGIDFYKAIPQPTLVIFTTAYAEYAVEGFTLNAVDYLLKPFTYERFLQAVTKANDYLRWQQDTAKPTETAYVYVRADYTLYKIALADILYVEGLDDYLKIHLQPGANQAGGTSGSRPVVARMTMKAMLEKLPDNQFIRVHRSFIVPFSRIEAVRNKTLSVAGREIPIGASYEAGLLSRFQP